MQGFVYVASASNGEFKIGMSNKPLQRVLSLNNKNIQHELIYTLHCKNCSKIESILHKMLYEYRSVGEYFKCDLSTIEQCILTLHKKYHFIVEGGDTPIVYRDEASSSVYSTLIPVQNALRKLGNDIRIARKIRLIPMALLAERASISRVTLAKIERGDPSVGISLFATVLFCLHMLDKFANLCESDDVGVQAMKKKLPTRIHLAGIKNKVV